MKQFRLILAVIFGVVEYEIEASGTVTLESGFNVEKGATFAVYPSSFYLNLLLAVVFSLILQQVT